MKNVEIAYRYRQLYSGVVYDAMVLDLGIRETACVMASSIRRMTDTEILVGPAMPCSGRAVISEQDIDDDVRLAMLHALTQGCVLVLGACDGAVAHFGDVSALLVKTRGAAGAVIDGATRDLDQIRRMEFPLFCRNSQPQDAYGRWQITEFGRPTLVMGIAGCVLTVLPGDWIFADGDGVLVIPQGKAEVVLVAAELRKENEDLIRAAMLDGEAAETIHARLGRW